MEHNPAQVDQVESILEKYQGRHNLLFRSLHKKYEVEPDVLEVRENLTSSLFTNFNPWWSVL